MYNRKCKQSFEMKKKKKSVMISSLIIIIYLLRDNYSAYIEQK